MKNKGVLITIVLILVFGVVITSYTSRITGQSGTMAADIPSAVSAYGAGAALPETAGGERTLKARMVPEMEEETAAPETSPEAIVMEDSGKLRSAPIQEETGAVSDENLPVTAAMEAESKAVMISPLSGSVESQEGEQSSSAGSRVDFYARLEKVDQQIAEARAEDMDSSTNAILSACSNELRIWEREVSDIYQCLISVMDEEDARALKDEQELWTREREREAQEAAAQYKGGTMESVEYTATMSSLTRSRAYELLEDYGDQLD